MARYSGRIGYSYSQETEPGVYTSSIIEKPIHGDVLKDYRRMNTDSINTGITAGVNISVIAEAYTMNHIPNIAYVTYLNSKWIVTGVTVEYPRLILSLGGLYNG